MPLVDLGRRVVAEAVGTALLLATVVGSGIMAERLAVGNIAVALLANSIATGAMLVALITTFGGISGAHFNPVVTLVSAARQRMFGPEPVAFIGAQIVGAHVGVLLAHVMFDLPPLEVSSHARSSTGQWISEAVATFGLIVSIWGTERHRPQLAPVVVGLYITSAYWFTASTSFANPAVTLARAATDTFAGIRLRDVAPFVGAQVLGGALAFALMRWLSRGEQPRAELESR